LAWAGITVAANAIARMNDRHPEQRVLDREQFARRAVVDRVERIALVPRKA